MARKLDVESSPLLGIASAKHSSQILLNGDARAPTPPSSKNSSRRNVSRKTEFANASHAGRATKGGATLNTSQIARYWWWIDVVVRPIWYVKVLSPVSRVRLDVRK